MENINNKLRLFEVAPDDTVGIATSWVLPGDVVVEHARLGVELTARNLERFLPHAETPKARFTQWAANQRVKRRYGSRPMLSHDARSKEEGNLINSHAFSVSIKEGKEKARTEQVGSLTYVVANETFHWSLKVGAREVDESLEDYCERALLDNGSLLPEDVRDFVEYAEEAMADLWHFRNVASLGSVPIRALMNHAFIRVGGFSMGKGGRFFLPRVDGISDAYTLGTALCDALTAASENKIQFFSLTVPRDPTSIRATTQVVQDSFLQQLDELEDEINGWEDFRLGMSDNRRVDLNELLQRLETFSDRWEMNGEDIKEKASRVADLLDAHDDRHKDVRVLREAAANAQASRKNGDNKRAERTKAAAFFSRLGEAEAHKVLAKINEAINNLDEQRIGGIKVEVEDDLTFGLTYKASTSRNGDPICAGEVTNAMQIFMEIKEALAKD
jgi:hypothetical protein